MNKQEIRRRIKEQKNTLSVEHIQTNSEIIIDKLMNSDDFNNSNDIYVYINFNQEVITTDLINRCFELGKNVYVPKVYNDIMKFHNIHSFSELQAGYYGILEPSNNDISNNREGLLIMPGLAFDKAHHRIGYGGGFYDKFLSKQHKFTLVALAFDFQVFENIATDVYDMCVDKIITEKNIY